jgi:hypothetical protein
MHQVVPYKVKMSYYAFMAFMFPVYITHYPLINFVNLCQVHLFLVLAGFLTDKHIFISMSALGIIILQLFWCLDFICETMGINFIGGTKYMYNSDMPLYVRILSLYHGWFPFFLIYLINHIGYNKRALYPQLILSNSVCILSYYNNYLYINNINMMKDIGIFGLFIISPTILFTTHRFLLWWDYRK